MFVNLCTGLGAHEGTDPERWQPGLELSTHRPLGNPLIPGSRVRYLAEIAEHGRAANDEVERLVALAGLVQHCYEALRAWGDPLLPQELDPYAEPALGLDDVHSPLRTQYNTALHDLGAEAIELLRGWAGRTASITAKRYTYAVRGREITGDNYRTSLSQQHIPKIAPPRFDGWGDRLRFLMKENLPGSYPYTGGVFPYRRESEDPTRMFAGEGTPERTNRRFHYVAAGQPAVRLSTAFDSVTLYGEDPAERPDIYGKVGNSGVSIATVDDAKKLYSGFDLCAPTTSVSMTINGPAPIILAFFMNAAIDQQVEKHLREIGAWADVEQKLDALFEGRDRPRYTRRAAVRQRRPRPGPARRLGRPGGGTRNVRADQV